MRLLLSAIGIKKENKMKTLEIHSTSSFNLAVNNVALIAGIAMLFALAIPFVVVGTSQANVALTDLQLSVGELVQPFSSDTLSYFASVPETESGISVVPFTNDPSAIITVQINGEQPTVVNNATASPTLPLEIGNNVIIVSVASAHASQQSRAYRLTIPKRTVRFQEGAGAYSGTFDTQIAQAVKYVDHNMGAQHKFEVGYSGPWARDQKYAMIRFDNLPIPDDATITEATLNVWYFGDRLSSGYENKFPDKEVYMHRIRIPWIEGNGGTETSHDGLPGQPGETTWNNFMKESAPFHFDIIDSIVVGTEPNWFSFELTDLANDWLKGKLPNYGVLLKTYEYPSNGDERMIGTKQFRSSEYVNVTERPYLSVIFTVPLQGLTLDVSALVLTAGQDPFAITAFPRPLNAEYTGIEWSSSNDAVAKVSQGLITPVSKGLAVVRATVSDGTISYSAEIEVTVK